MPAEPTIEGGSPEQRALLENIVANFGSTRIAQIAIRPFQATSEEGDLPLPGDHGDEIFITTKPADLRGGWEAELLAVAFARRSKAERLRRVVWFALSDSGTTLEHMPPPIKTGMTLEHTWPPIETMSTASLERFGSDVAAAAADASLEAFDVLRPQGHAVALAIRVDEAHSFLRFRSTDFLGHVAEWRERCDGIFGEIRDEAPTPALTFGWFRGGGFSSTRRDVECCAPFLGMSHPIDWQGPPPCPVFDAP